MIVVINTAFHESVVGVGDGGQLLGFAGDTGWPAELDKLLTSALCRGGMKGVGLSTLNVVAVVTGPGRFGAVRGGIAYAKGLALARNVPLIGVPAVALVGAIENRSVAVVLPAGRDRWYVASAHDQDAFCLAHVTELDQVLASDEIVVGPVDRTLAEVLESAGRQTHCVTANDALCEMLKLTVSRVVKGCGPATLGANPLYVQPPTTAMNVTSRFLVKSDG